MCISHLRWVAPAALVCSVLLTASTSSHAQSAPDNTKTNTADRAKNTVTADQQKNNAADRALTQRIRKAITADKSFSTYARNVKVISQGGEVTLRGPVRSDAEKQRIEAKAVELAGAGHVKNEMSVAPVQKSTSK
jgi:hyperosmotically inducible protein